MFARAARGLIGLSLLGLGGCATFSDSFGAIEHNLATDQPLSALSALEQQRHGRGDQVLFLLNKAMLLRMARDYEGSNAAFAEAKQQIDAFYGMSVSEQAASFLINDTTRAYVGEEFEQTLIYLYSALNFLELGRPGEARVEALQVDQKLREHAERVSESRYTEDALVRYLTGKIYEELGEWSDAMIAYRKAYAAYVEYQRKYGTPVPRFLGPDLIRLAHRLGLHQELEQYRREFKTTDGAARATELIFLLHAGLAPVKRENSATIINPATGRLVRLSLPRYEPRAETVTRARISVGVQTATTELAEDISAIAMHDLEAEMPKITARALARMVAKDQTAREVGERNGLLGLALNVTNVLTERADTRSWLTLPGRIHLAALPLEPGTYDVRVELLDAAGGVVATRDYSQIAVRAGRKSYLSYHWVPPAHPSRR